MWYRFAINEPKYSPLEEKAIEQYGITGNYRKAGYILQDGTLIDFSEGYHDRALDHRDISNIMPQNETYDNDYENYVIPFVKETGALRVSYYGEWNVDINSKPSNAQINRIVSGHTNGNSFIYDLPDQEGKYIDSATKDQVFHLLKKIQNDWDLNYVV